MAQTAFDVVVVGGGITGAAIALVLSGQGYETALVEKSDFCAATSANSLKIVHGGLRYIQDADFKRMRESIRCRKALMKFAPGLVKPLPCLMPLYGYGLASPETAWLALKINDLFSFDRNRGMDVDHRIPDGRIVSARECLQRFPMLAENGLRGGCRWTDAISENSERLTLEVVMAAHARGACVANYLCAEKLFFSRGAVQAVGVRDVHTDKCFEVKTRWVVDATGPWVNRILPGFGTREKTLSTFALGMNLIVNKTLFPEMAVGIEGLIPRKNCDALPRRGKRAFFFVPLARHTIIGTSYRFFEGHPGQLDVTLDHILEFVRQINTIYPPAQLSLADVASYHAGLLPARAPAGRDRDGEVRLIKHPRIFDHGRLGGKEGALSVAGVKFTTAVQVARDAARILKKKINPKYLPGAARPGQRAYAVSALQRAETKPELTPDKMPSLIRCAFEKEMAYSLADLVFRRLGMGHAACPGLEDLTAMAGIAGDLAGWDAQRTRREVQGVVRQFFPLPSARADMARLENRSQGGL